MSGTFDTEDGQPTVSHPTQQSPEKAVDRILPNESSTSEEKLPRVADKIPVSVWLVILVSTLERFAFFGIREPFPDQYTNWEDKVVVKPNGEKVIIDRDLSMDRIYHAYYWAVNIGALSALATTFMEKDIGFWAAYLLPFCALCTSLLTLALCRNKIVKLPPGGNILPKAFRIMLCAAKNGFNMDAARPHNRPHSVDWDDKFVTDLKRGLVACRIFAFYPILWVAHLQINNNLVSQAAQMNTDGLPNDIFPTLNPIAVLILLPIVTNLLYPLLRKMRVEFPPVNRMAIGFLIEAIAIAYCAGIQQLIYTKPPCYSHVLECPASNHGILPNQISVWAQTPTYVLDGLAEIFFDVVSQEYGYNKAPDNVRRPKRFNMESPLTSFFPIQMKSIVQAVLSAMSGVGAVLGFALYPVAHNPNLVWMYTALAAAIFLASLAFWLCFRKYNAEDADMNRRD
ncbi:peptide transporter ptr2 [Penicillium chermesinum]|nr:peptide transporter ptr2 [Penicillium chermesinum]